MNYVITVDTKKCVACRSCELQCAVFHSNSKNIFQAIGEKPLPQKRIFVEGAYDVNFPLQCRQCEDPPCAKICPTQAITKASESEPVKIDHERCIGCKYCLIACPFGVIVLSKDDRKIIKCDLCMDTENEAASPRCVESCPTKALHYLPSEELTKRKRREFMVEFLES